MSETNQTKDIWQQISGAEQLRDIYGYFPTLHDAVVQNIDIRFESREVILTFRYNDLVEKSADAIESQDSATTRFQICWREVERAKLGLYGEDIIGVSFSRNADFIETRFENYAFGFDGFIVARSIEVFGMEQISETEEQTSDSSRSIKLTIENKGS